MKYKKTGFNNSTDFCIYLEQLKSKLEFDSYIETIVYYSEHESDVDLEQLVKFLNKKIVDGIKYEASQNNLFKDETKLISLF